MAVTIPNTSRPCHNGVTHVYTQHTYILYNSDEDLLADYTDSLCSHICTSVYTYVPVLYVCIYILVLMVWQTQNLVTHSYLRTCTIHAYVCVHSNLIVVRALCQGLLGLLQVPAELAVLLTHSVCCLWLNEPLHS